MTYDKKTFQFYADNAQEYAEKRTKPSKMLMTFLERVPPTGSVLELGCGAGLESEYMKSLGLNITATEGNPELAKFAIKRLGSSAKIMRFDELSDQITYDGVWANMCLLHAPWDTLPSIIKSIHEALKPGGLLMASFKSGEGAARDKLDRYYNLPTQEDLQKRFETSATWAELILEQGHSGVGHDGTPYDTLWVKARR